jgi:hypothetical protein
MSDEKISILPKVGDIRFTEEMGWQEYNKEYGWLAIPAADVPLDDLLLCYEDLIIELSQKETEHIEVKEDYDSKEFEIVFLSDINFKELYGSTSEKVRKQHASTVLKPLKTKLNGFELSIDYLKRYISFLRELIRVKRTIMECKQ